MYKAILKSVGQSENDLQNFEGDIYVSDDINVRDEIKCSKLTSGNLSSTNATISNDLSLTKLSANSIPIVNAEKKLVSDTGLLYDTITDTLTSPNITLGNNLTLSNLTANTIPVLNGSKQLVSDTNLTIDTTTDIVTTNNIKLNNLSTNSIVYTDNTKTLKTDANLTFNDTTDTLTVSNLTLSGLNPSGNVLYTDVFKSVKSEDAFRYNPVDNILTVDNITSSGNINTSIVECDNFRQKTKTVSENFILTLPTVINGVVCDLYHRFRSGSSPFSIASSMYSYFDSLHTRIHTTISGFAIDMSNQGSTNPSSANFVNRLLHDFANNVWILPSSRLLVGTNVVQSEPFHVAGNNYTIARFRRQTLTPNVASNIAFENSNSQSSLIGCDASTPDLMLSPNSILRYRVNEHIIPMANNSQDLGSSSLRYRDVWGNNIVGLNTSKIYANITTNSSVATLNSGFGVSSVTRTGLSQVQINFSSSFGNTNYTWIASSGFLSSTAQSNFVSSPNMNNWKQTGSIRLQSYYGNQQTNIDITDLNVVIFGS